MTNEICINEARTILNKMLQFAGENGFYPEEIDFHNCNILIADVKKYFENITTAHYIADKYYNDMYYNLDFVIDNSVKYIKYIQYHKQYTKDNPCKTRKWARIQGAKRRGWAKPKSINQYFEGSHLHHTHLNGDTSICIYIPINLHESIYHAYNKPETMEKINKLAFEWLATCDVI